MSTIYLRRNITVTTFSEQLTLDDAFEQGIRFSDEEMSWQLNGINLDDGDLILKSSDYSVIVPGTFVVPSPEAAS